MLQDRIEQKRIELPQKAKIISYKANPYCEVLGLVNAETLISFYDFVREAIRYENNTPYNDRLSLNEELTSVKKKEWMLSKIQSITTAGDVIILPFHDFGIRLCLTEVSSFFLNEIAQCETEFVGWDIGYSNETKGCYQYFSDEEYYLFEYERYTRHL